MLLIPLLAGLGVWVWPGPSLLRAAGLITAAITGYSAFYFSRRYGLLAGLYSVALMGVGLFCLGPGMVSVFAGWELVSVAAWGLIGGARGISARSLNVAMLAFLVNRLGDAFWLASAYAGGRFSVGWVVAAMVKGGMFPFTFWLVQAMYAPAAVSALLHSALLVALGVYLPLREPPLEGVVGLSQSAYRALGWGSAAVSALGAFLTRSPKGLLAWSTAAHLALLLAEWPVPSYIEKPLLAHSFLKAALFLTLGLAQKGYGGWGMAMLWYGLGGLLAAFASPEPVPLAIETLLALAVGRAGRTLTQGRRRPAVWMCLPMLVLAAGAIGVGFPGQVAALLPVSAIFAGRMVPLWVKLRIDWPFLWAAQKAGGFWQRIGIALGLLEWRLVRATNALARLHVQNALHTTRIDQVLLVRVWEGLLRRLQRAVAQFFTPFSGMQAGLRWAFWVTLLIGFVWKLLH